MPEQFDDAPDFSLRDILGTLSRRRWVIIQAFIFVTVIGLVSALLSQSVYATTAEMLVETQTPTFVMGSMEQALAPILQRMRQTPNMNTQLEVLRSADFRERVKSNVVPTHVSAPVSLSYAPKGDTQIIQISAESPDPAAAAAWANTAAKEYEKLTRESNRGTVSRAKKYLVDAKVDAAKRLQKAEKKLLEFRNRTQFTSNTEEQSADHAQAASWEDRLREVRNELIALDSRIAGMQERLKREPETRVRVRTLVNPEREAIRSQIAQLRTQRAVLLGQFEPESYRIKDIDEQIASLERVQEGLPVTVQDRYQEVNTVREELESKLREMELERNAKRATEASLAQYSGAKTQRARQVPVWQVQQTILERERDMADKTFRDYAEQLRVLEVREEVLESTAALLQEAPIPAAPVRPQRTQQVALAMVMGLLLGVGFAFLQEFLDDRVNTSEDIERLTALPTLGVVPTIPEDHNRLLIGHDALSPVTESYRSLRTGVQYSFVDRPIQRIIVTSAHPGEGKSVTSANLGIAIALQGKRVILIDADLRRPSTHRLFRIEAEPGLTSVLAGEVPLQEALHATPIDGFQVLTCGPLPPNPPELLNSQVMMDLLMELEQHADLVIIDTPPVIPVTDAQVLAPHVDGVVLVVEAGQARKAAVKHARDLLAQTRGRVLGVVLNKIDQSSKGYYYHYYYRGSYRKYRRYGYRKGYGGYGGYGYGGYGYGGYGYGGYGYGGYGYGGYGYGYGGGYGRSQHRLGVPEDGHSRRQQPDGKESGGQPEQERSLPEKLKDWE